MTVSRTQRTGAKDAAEAVESADADYVRAVVAIKEGDAQTAIELLKKAVEAKPALKESIKNDVTFCEIIDAI